LLLSFDSTKLLNFPNNINGYEQIKANSQILISSNILTF